MILRHIRPTSMRFFPASVASLHLLRCRENIGLQFKYNICTTKRATKVAFAQHQCLMCALGSGTRKRISIDAEGTKRQCCSSRAIAKGKTLTCHILALNVSSAFFPHPPCFLDSRVFMSITACWSRIVLGSGSGHHK